MSPTFATDLQAQVRLAEVKAAWDPDDLFTANKNIPPAAPG